MKVLNILFLTLVALGTHSFALADSQLEIVGGGPYRGWAKVTILGVEGAALYSGLKVQETGRVTLRKRGQNIHCQLSGRHSTTCTFLISPFGEIKGIDGI